MKHIAWITILGLAVRMSVPAPAYAGTVYESSLRDLRTNTTGTMRMQAEGGKLRIEQATGDAREATLIYRDDTVYVLNPKNKSYVTIDRPAVKRLAEQLRQTQEQLAKLPPAQRAMMESIGGQLGATTRTPPTLRPTERTEKVAGYPCKIVSVLEADVVLRELCVAPPGKLKGGQEVYDVAVKMGALFDEILTTLDAPWLTTAMAQQLDNYGKIGGVPLLTRSYEQGKLARETRLQSMRSEALPSTQFEVPADYQPRDLIRQ